jgi:hypothetical protein
MTVKFEKPRAELAACCDRTRALSMPFSLVAVVATVLVAVGTTLQK